MHEWMMMNAGCRVDDECMMMMRADNDGCRGAHSAGAEGVGRRCGVKQDPQASRRINKQQGGAVACNICSIESGGDTGAYSFGSIFIREHTTYPAIMGGL